MFSLPVFCRSLGCLDPQCVLCEHNPHRRCNVNFAPKYLVNDVLKAKCDAPIRVEIIDRQTGVPLGEDIADVHLEVTLTDLISVPYSRLPHTDMKQKAMMLLLQHKRTLLMLSVQPQVANAMSC